LAAIQKTYQNAIQTELELHTMQSQQFFKQYGAQLMGVTAGPAETPADGQPNLDPALDAAAEATVVEHPSLPLDVLAPPPPAHGSAAINPSPDQRVDHERQRRASEDAMRKAQLDDARRAYMAKQLEAPAVSTGTCCCSRCLSCCQLLLLMLQKRALLIFPSGQDEAPEVKADFADFAIYYSATLVAYLTASGYAANNITLLADYTEADVTSFKKCEDYKGFQHPITKPLKVATDENVTAAILDALKAEPKVLFVLYSGHGMRGEEGSGLTGNFCLSERTSLSATKWRESFTKEHPMGGGFYCQDSTFVVLLNKCFAGVEAPVPANACFSNADGVSTASRPKDITICSSPADSSQLLSHGQIFLHWILELASAEASYEDLGKALAQARREDSHPDKPLNAVSIWMGGKLVSSAPYSQDVPAAPLSGQFLDIASFS
jgi:hypothetical protein